MATAPGPKHPDLPGLIFGCPPSKHRTSSMRRLLRRYNVQVNGNERKEDTLHKLVELEKSIGEREKEALVNWFAGEGTYRALAALLGDAMKPPITPKNIGEPAARKAKLEESDDDIIFAAVNECRICMENLTPEMFPQTRISSTCAHHPAVCNQCLTKHINDQVQTKASNQISCPECPEKVSDAEIKKYASPEVLERNGRRLLNISLQHLPNFTFCLSLTCESGQIHSKPDDPMMTCTTCGFKTCFIHKLPWHGDLTCAEFDISNQARVRQEAASEAWIAEHTKLCPNPKCGMRIQKKSGCDHLTCDYCLVEFCGCCFADSKLIKKRGNDHHKEDCRWHTKNENGMPGHDRRRGSAPKKSKKPIKSEDSKKSDAGPAPKEPNISEDPKEIKEGLKQSHSPVKPSEAADGMQLSKSKVSDDLKHSFEPNVTEDSKRPNQPQEPVEPSKQTESTEALGLNIPNPLKRLREE
ncbi:putative ring finger protein [Botrytis fragariae]|uniref:RBR-type E3 ubiquitin transferase n=1 Tax=Botrytis fragariae TaxID=1964551 RepID=A0A8H6ATH6_9HELO|nr:putative ring finger protein [Botrytis fragariae]KAF5873283.1 putative ring finger protein [Botrytis fragariae]